MREYSKGLNGNIRWIITGCGLQRTGLSGDEDFEPDLVLFEGDGRHAENRDFYEDWARTEFGGEAGAGAAKIFQRLDGHLPRPTRWLDGPGNIFCNSIPWEEEREIYRFVDEFAVLEPLVTEAECKKRFRYWYHTFSALRLSGKVGCLWGSIRGYSERKEPSMVFTAYQELTETFCQLEYALLMSLETSGEMGVLANLQQRSILPILRDCGRILREMKIQLPELPKLKIEPCSKLAVTCIRTSIRMGEELKLKVIVIGGAEKVSLYYGKMGKSSRRRAEFTHLQGWVYEIIVTEENLREDFEYHITAEAGERMLRFPDSEKEREQSVIVLNERDYQK